MNTLRTLDNFLEYFQNGGSLSGPDTELFFDLLLGEEDEPLLGQILSAWNEKGVSEDELFELSSIMRKRAIKVRSKHTVFVDTVGTGGSSAKTFNVSTAAAFVIAGAGVPVAKHGNRAATSHSGSADVLQELGVNPAVTARIAEECLNTLDICFLFAPNFHKLSPILGKVRRELGAPTIFNNLGPLCNPANAPHQVIGVWRDDLVEKTANVLARLGTKKSWVVRGEDGLDEISLSASTHVAEITVKGVRHFTITPSDFGITAESLEHSKRTTPGDSAALIRSIFQGNGGSAATNLVLINAAAPIFLTGKASGLEAAFKLAKASIDSGSALRKLDDLVTATNR